MTTYTEQRESCKKSGTLVELTCVLCGEEKYPFCMKYKTLCKLEVCEGERMEAEAKDASR